MPCETCLVKSLLKTPFQLIMFCEDFRSFVTRWGLSLEEFTQSINRISSELCPAAHGYSREGMRLNF